MWDRRLNFSIITIVLYINFIGSASSHFVHQLEPGGKVSPQRTNELGIYCYSGRPKNIINVWQAVQLKINSVKNDLDVYEGRTPEEVAAAFEAHHSTWSYNLFATKSKYVKLDPFAPSCIGIHSTSSYQVELVLIRVDYWKVLSLVLGIFLFLLASKLSENSLFYYICGVSFGVGASFLILIYFISKLFPRKPLMYGFIVGGWTISVYFLQMMWDNFRSIVTSYQEYIVYYVLGTGLISFVICYRLGPPTNPRSKNLIRWCLQSVGLFAIYRSSHFVEATCAAMVILVLSYNFPRLWISKAKTLWRRKFPPKASLLSNDEYYHQGVVETNRALNELRQYCSSPECNQWKTVLKIKDAKRFASFIEGQSHLSDDEILEYEQSIHIDDADLTDDSSSSIDL